VDPRTVAGARVLSPVSFEMLQVGFCRHPECVALRGGSLRPVVFPAMCALIRHPGFGNWLFDTGYGEHFRAATQPFPERLYRWVTPIVLPEDQRLVAQLAARGLRPGDIDGVVISHFHADHIGALRDFPRATLVASRAGHAHVDGMSRVRALSQGFLPALLPPDFHERSRFLEGLPRVALPPELQPFGQGVDVLGDASLIAVPLHGHAHQQFGLLLRRLDGRVVLLSADACWSMRALRESRPPTWIAQRIFADRSGYRATFEKLRALATEHPDILLVPSHCQETARALVGATKPAAADVAA
jgi:glyoxylase-like metal-dependent hydrolase (beta-lactamase superfamily II)